MPSYTTLAWMLAMTLLGDPATPSPASIPSPMEAEVQLRGINHRVVDSARSPDPAFLEALLDPEFFFIDADGNWIGRDAYGERSRQPATLDAVAYDQVHVRRFGDVALVHGVLHGHARAGGSTRLRYTDVYAWDGVRWHWISGQRTPITKAATDAGPGSDDAAALPVGARWQGEDPQGDDLAVLTTLNADYVQAFRDADVGWYDAHLASDYQVVFGDGSIHDRAAALRDFAKPYFAEGIASFPVDKVRVRRLGDVALIHAENAYALKDGRTGVNRYTDIWVRFEGRWRCVAAHITVHRKPE